MKKQDVTNRLSPASEKRKFNKWECCDNREQIYNNMKKLLERKYKKVISRESSGEKLFQKNKITDKIVNKKIESNVTLLSDIPSSKKRIKLGDKKVKLSANMTDGNKLPYHQTNQLPQIKNMDRQSQILDQARNSKILNLNEINQNENCKKVMKKLTRRKLPKRIIELSRPRPLSKQVKKDMSYEPFKIPKKALLFQATPRLLKLAIPVKKRSREDILSDKEAFSVKKRALKAKCSRRISELAFPVVRSNEIRIKAISPNRRKQRALMARCSKRVRQLARPLPRRISKDSNRDKS